MRSVLLLQPDAAPAILHHGWVIRHDSVAIMFDELVVKKHYFKRLVVHEEGTQGIELVPIHRAIDGPLFARMRIGGIIPLGWKTKQRKAHNAYK